jgi:cytochrome oxidase Cu insertion factor (SCO1/SenC/PrrC family)
MNELMKGERVGAPFALPDANGRRRSLAEFRGRVVLLYFGYTTCPDTCPTDLARIAGALRRLGDRAHEVQPIFVTLDPARDTPRLLRNYVAAFDPRFIALRGTAAGTRRIASDWKVYYERRTGKDAGLIDHTAFTFVIGRDGQYRGFMPPGTPSDRMASFLTDELDADAAQAAARASQDSPRR